MKGALAAAGEPFIDKAEVAKAVGDAAAHGG
jgi:hypothetical protein